MKKVVWQWGITREQYQELSEKYSKKQKEFERKLANLLDTNKDYYDTACDILDLASRAYELYLGSELNEKREILNLLFQNLYLKDEKLVYKLNKPFDSILVCNDRLEWLPIYDIFLNCSNLSFLVNFVCSDYGQMISCIRNYLVS